MIEGDSRTQHLNIVSAHERRTLYHIKSQYSLNNNNFRRIQKQVANSLGVEKQHKTDFIALQQQQQRRLNNNLSISHLIQLEKISAAERFIGNNSPLVVQNVSPQTEMSNSIQAQLQTTRINGGQAPQGEGSMLNLQQTRSNKTGTLSAQGSRRSSLEKLGLMAVSGGGRTTKIGEEQHEEEEDMREGTAPQLSQALNISINKKNSANNNNNNNKRSSTQSIQSKKQKYQVIYNKNGLPQGVAATNGGGYNSRINQSALELGGGSLVHDLSHRYDNTPTNMMMMAAAAAAGTATTAVPGTTSSNSNLNISANSFLERHSKKVRARDFTSQNHLNDFSEQLLSEALGVTTAPQQRGSTFNNSKTLLLKQLFPLKHSMKEIQLGLKNLPFKNKSYDEMLLLLKNHNYFSSSDTLPSRLEVVLLLKWLESVMDGITLQEDLTLEERHSRRQSVLSLVMEETIRQVSMECGERGAILRKIWEGLQQHFIKQMDYYQIQLLAAKTDVFAEKDKVFEYFKNQILEGEQAMTVLRLHLLEKDKKLSESAQEVKEAQTKTQNMLKENQKIKNYFILMKRKIIAQNKIVETLQLKLQRLNLFGTKGKAVPVSGATTAIKLQAINAENVIKTPNDQLPVEQGATQETQPEEPQLQDNLQAADQNGVATQQQTTGDEDDEAEVGEEDDNLEFMDGQLTSIDQLNNNAMINSEKVVQLQSVETQYDESMRLTDACSQEIQTELSGMCDTKFDSLFESREKLLEILEFWQFKEQMDLPGFQEEEDQLSEEYEQQLQYLSSLVEIAQQRSGNSQPELQSNTQPVTQQENNFQGSVVLQEFTGQQSPKRNQSTERAQSASLQGATVEAVEAVSNSFHRKFSIQQLAKDNSQNNQNNQNTADQQQIAMSGDQKQPQFSLSRYGPFRGDSQNVTPSNRHKPMAYISITRTDKLNNNNNENKLNNQNNSINNINPFVFAVSAQNSGVDEKRQHLGKKMFQMQELKLKKIKQEFERERERLQQSLLALQEEKQKIAAQLTTASDNTKTLHEELKKVREQLEAEQMPEDKNTSPSHLHTQLIMQNKITPKGQESAKKSAVQNRRVSVNKPIRGRGTNSNQKNAAAHSTTTGGTLSLKVTAEENEGDGKRRKSVRPPTDRFANGLEGSNQDEVRAFELDEGEEDDYGDENDMLNSQEAYSIEDQEDEEGEGVASLDTKKVRRRKNPNPRTQTIQSFSQIGPSMNVLPPTATTVSRAPRLGQRTMVTRKFNKQLGVGRQIIERIRNKKLSKFNNFMSLKTVLKLITTIYSERVALAKQDGAQRELDMASFTYQYFSSQFGISKLADQKFLVLALSVRRHMSIFRVNLFARFLALSEGAANYQKEELNKYIELLDFVTNISNAGPPVPNTEGDTHFYIPYIRAVQYTSHFGDGRMRRDEIQQLRREIDKIREGDRIDFDLYSYHLLEVYRLMVSRAKRYVRNAFAACDLDGNGVCSLSEWILLNKHIEDGKIAREKLEEYFNDNADVLEDGADEQMSMSFDKFAVLSVELKLFTDEAQNRFLSIESDANVAESFAELQKEWDKRKLMISMRINEHRQQLSEEDYEAWTKNLEVLEQRVRAENDTQQELKPLLIAYHILDRESKELEGQPSVVN